MRSVHLCCLGVLVCLGLAAAEPLQPVATLRPARGFIDDAFLLSPDGDTLYFVVTDGATFAELRAAAWAGQGAPSDRLIADGLPVTTTGLLLLSGDRILVVASDPEGGRKTGHVYALSKPAPGAVRVGPATDIVLSTVRGAPALMVVTIPDGGQGEHRFQAIDAATLRTLADRRYRSEVGGLRAGAALVRPLFWIDHYQTLVGKLPGDYDRKNDIRQPDRLALLETLSGRIRSTLPIQDPAGLAEGAQLFAGHPGQSLFVAHDPEGGRLELVRFADGQVIRRVLRMPRPLSFYDPATLRYQALGADRLLVSLTVDPVHEAAVRQRRRDADIIDLCLVDVQDAAVRCVGEIPGKERPTNWTAVPGTLALLRKHRGFSRGGTELEVYRLDTGAGR
ncbi:MAG: hypothetical protein RMK29_12605 [Myxococcales bacterium]|nr:hypothetical protein [Myxococcota bacterium]MDW8282545.1 hypothetical protein [Myxococcales bacterium]